MTVLCKTSWKSSIVFFQSLNISESSLRNIKKKQPDTKTSLYIRINLILTPIILNISCHNNAPAYKTIVLHKYLIFLLIFSDVLLLEEGLFDQIRVDHGKEFYLLLFIQESLA